MFMFANNRDFGKLLTYIHTYIYEIYSALIVEDGSNQRRGLLLGGGV